MRISVVGSPGSGKTTLARRAAERLGCDHIELDAIHHQPNWEPLESELFVERLAARLAAEAWVCDGNYLRTHGGLVQARADTIVWFDLPRATVLRQVTWRTVRRVVRREVLWNGNREPLTNLTRWDPRLNIIRWAWTCHEEYRRAFERLSTDGTWRHATVVRLRDRDQADRWLQETDPCR